MLGLCWPKSVQNWSKTGTIAPVRPQDHVQTGSGSFKEVLGRVRAKKLRKWGRKWVENTQNTPPKCSHTIWGPLWAIFDFWSKRSQIARYRPLKMARIGVLHYNRGKKGSKKCRKKAENTQNTPPKCSHTIWVPFLKFSTTKNTIFYLSEPTGSVLAGHYTVDPPP